jgi:hypothetical protein
MRHGDENQQANEQDLFNKNAGGNEGFLAAMEKDHEMSALLSSTI